MLGPDLTELGLAAGRASRQMESDNPREGRTTHTAPGSLREGPDVLAMNASQGHLIQTQAGEPRRKGYPDTSSEGQRTKKVRLD